MNVQECLSRGNDLFNKNDFNGAIIEYKEIIKIDPNNVDAKNNISTTYFNRGLANYRNGDNEKAIADIKEALVYNPKDASIYGALGSIYDEMGNHDEVIKCFTEVIKLEPTALAYFSRAMSYYQKSKEYLKTDDDKNYLNYFNLVINDQELAVKNDPNNVDFKKSLDLMKSELEKRISTLKYMGRI